MELDLENEFAERAYPILASLVTPRPIALVTTLSADGRVNAAPFSLGLEEGRESRPQIQASTSENKSKHSNQ